MVWVELSLEWSEEGRGELLGKERCEVQRETERDGESGEQHRGVARRGEERRGAARSSKVCYEERGKAMKSDEERGGKGGQSKTNQEPAQEKSMSSARAREHLTKAKSLLESAITTSPVVHPDYTFYLAEVFLELAKTGKDADREFFERKATEYLETTISKFGEIAKMVRKLFFFYSGKLP
jgi:hypothetical protein